jgi:hypothetical protein
LANILENFQKKQAFFVIFALGLTLLFLGCMQTTTQAGETTKYVCADGKTIVSDISACPVGAAPNCFHKKKKAILYCCQNFLLFLTC